ncbi:hypothetical protein [Belnapia rosea]|uniref:Uncharacterized protein n=1 Tax=Belnapia rosea TaxID=938405 RepID=A0A1G6ZVU4_9PROT|nr:hypothetical protein [Belnapia rosea]SDE05965.1 hypothetical protein SAMN04487779_101793 [Belnapia rosea]
MPMDAMLTEDAEPAATLVTPSEVRGLIDNATADRLYGWVWDATHPGFRVPVELRLAGEVVASTVAENARPDLAKHGIGDGCHAFEFSLQRQWFRQLRELTVIAYGKDGVACPVPVHARRQQDEMLVPAQATAQLQSAAESLLTEHRAIRREMEELRERSAALPDQAAVQAIAQAGQELQRRLDSLELWITRLDEKLAQLTTPAQETKGGLDPWQVVLIALLVGAVCGVMAFIVARYGS